MPEKVKRHSSEALEIFPKKWTPLGSRVNNSFLIRKVTADFQRAFQALTMNRFEEYQPIAKCCLLG
jgi:hypothetical protein